MPTLEEMRLNTSGAMRAALDRRRAEEEANAKAHTFDPGKMIIPTITSILTQNPTPFLLAAGGEGARAATGSDMDLASAAQSLSGFLPTKPIETAAQKTTTAMQGASRLAPPPIALRGDLNPVENFVGKMGSNFGYAPMSRNEQAAADVISSGGLKPKSVNYNGIPYELPQKTYEEKLAEQMALLSQHPELASVGNIKKNIPKTFAPKTPKEVDPLKQAKADLIKSLTGTGTGGEGTSQPQAVKVSDGVKTKVIAYTDYLKHKDKLKIVP